MASMRSMCSSKGVGVAWAAVAVLLLATPTQSLVTSPASHRLIRSTPSFVGTVTQPRLSGLRQHLPARLACSVVPAMPNCSVRKCSKAIIFSRGGAACQLFCLYALIALPWAQTPLKPKIQTPRPLTSLRGGAPAATAVLTSDFVLKTLAPLMVRSLMLLQLEETR